MTVDAALGQLRQEGFLVRDEDVARLSPFIYERHINLLGRYSFAVPEAVTRGELRPLRNPNERNTQPCFTFHCSLTGGIQRILDFAAGVRFSREIQAAGTCV